MIYLLDVNALVALGIFDHQFHERVARWMHREGLPDIATCSITEIGFIRVSMQAAAYRHEFEQARLLLQRLKQSSQLRHRFIADPHDSSHLPSWVKGAKQITDGHLLELARANGAALATLDEKIPGAYLIPRT